MVALASVAVLSVALCAAVLGSGVQGGPFWRVLGESLNDYDVESVNRSVSLTHSTTVTETTQLTILPGSHILEARKSGVSAVPFYYALPFLQAPRLSYFEAKIGGIGVINSSVVKFGEFSMIALAIPESAAAAGSKAPINITLSMQFSGFAEIESRSIDVWGARSGSKMYSRDLIAKMCVEAYLPYNCRRQQTTFEFERGTYRKHEVSPGIDDVVYDATKTTLTCGPYFGTETGMCRGVDLYYSSQNPSLKVESTRSVYIRSINLPVTDSTKAPAGAAAYAAGAATVRVVDSIVATNTDPAPAFGKYSRPAIYGMKTTHVPHTIVPKIELFIPTGAKNIQVGDRVGRIESYDLTDSAGFTVVSVHPRHDLFGGDIAKFYVSYDLNVTKDATTTSSDSGAKVIELPFGPRIPQSYYESHSMCIYFPDSASDIEIHTPFPGATHHESTSSQAVLSTSDRQGICIDRGVTSEGFILRPLLITWKMDQAAEIRSKLTFTATLILAALLAISAGRIIF